jgi:hypothetical protein
MVRLGISDRNCSRLPLPVWCRTLGLKAALLREPQCEAAPSERVRGVIVLSRKTGSWRSATLTEKYWDSSIHLHPNTSLNVNLTRLGARDRKSNRALATAFDYVRQRQGWWTVLEDDAIMLRGCDYGALPTPVPKRFASCSRRIAPSAHSGDRPTYANLTVAERHRSCWYVSMDRRGYFNLPTKRLSAYYDQSVGDRGYGTAGFFIHSKAAQHYYATHHANVHQPLDLIVHESSVHDPVARGRVCFMRPPGPRVAHDNSLQTSLRRGGGGNYERRDAKGNATDGPSAARRQPAQPWVFTSPSRHQRTAFALSRRATRRPSRRRASLAGARSY